MFWQFCQAPGMLYIELLKTLHHAGSATTSLSESSKKQKLTETDRDRDKQSSLDT